MKCKAFGDVEQRCDIIQIIFLKDHSDYSVESNLQMGKEAQRSVSRTLSGPAEN